MPIIYQFKNFSRVFVELPGNFMYGRNEKYSEDEWRARDAHLIKIGGNVREAKLMFKSLIRGGYDACTVEPVNQTKWNSALFKRRFNVVWNTNQHERDAARLAWVWGDRRLK